jgi:hypothetical protein
MTLEEACATVLGKDAADSIIADQGVLWCAVAAIAAARTSHPRPALEALRDYLAKVKHEGRSR